jgi:hypothetical protein
MRRFACRCGARVFYESSQCLRCGAKLGFDPARLMITAAGDEDDGIGSTAARPCRNRDEHRLCNWWVSADSANEYCASCSLTEVIPNLSRRQNRVLWGRMEQAKRRLLYDLLRLGLFSASVTAPFPAPTFRFLEDRRRNPLVEESFVLTGHYAGTITINLAEADDVARQAVREQMRERYRTLLGHFRHESGHFYFDRLLAAVGVRRERFRDVFGDERADYAAAIAAHHQRGQQEAVDTDRYVSRYAASHPLEDWAETWAHYLHIGDTLETAEACEIAPLAPQQASWIERWAELSVTLNELNRSLGLDDAYPFTLSPAVVAKLEFVREALSGIIRAA